MLNQDLRVGENNKMLKYAQESRDIAFVWTGILMKALADRDYSIWSHTNKWGSFFLVGADSKGWGIT